MKQNNKDFVYTYSAPTAEERKEIESIRGNYTKVVDKTSDKLTLLRKLDNKAKNTPATIALIVGILTTLVMGVGLTMVLEWHIVVWGVIVGVVGLIPTCLVYPMYLQLSKYYKNKYRQQILDLSDELLNDENK